MPFADAEAHLARREVGDEHDVATDQRRRIAVGRADAGEDLALAEFARVEFEAQQLVGAFDELAGQDLRRRAGRASRSRRWRWSRRAVGGAAARSARLSALRLASATALARRRAPAMSLLASIMCVDVLRVDAGEQRLVRVDAVREQRRARGRCQRRDGRARGSLRRCATTRGSTGLSVGGEHAEQVQALRAHRLQLRIARLPAWRAPTACARRCTGSLHRPAPWSWRSAARARCASYAAAIVRQRVDEARVHRGVGQRVGELAVEALVDEARAAAGEVDELADQVGVHARDEVVEVQVEVVDAAAGLGGEVVAQRFGIEARRRGRCAP